MAWETSPLKYVNEYVKNCGKIFKKNYKDRFVLPKIALPVSDWNFALNYWTWIHWDYKWDITFIVSPCSPLRRAPRSYLVFDGLFAIEAHLSPCVWPTNLPWNYYEYIQYWAWVEEVLQGHCGSNYFKYNWTKGWRSWLVQMIVSSDHAGGKTMNNEWDLQLTFLMQILLIPVFW